MYYVYLYVTPAKQRNHPSYVVVGNLWGKSVGWYSVVWVETMRFITWTSQMFWANGSSCYLMIPLIPCKTCPGRALTVMIVRVNCNSRELISTKILETWCRLEAVLGARKTLRSFTWANRRRIMRIMWFFCYAPKNAKKLGVSLQGTPQILCFLSTFLHDLSHFGHFGGIPWLNHRLGWPGLRLL